MNISTLIPGEKYDVHPSLGNYLVSQRFAERLADTHPMLLVPMDASYGDDFDRLVYGGVHVAQSEREIVADTPLRGPNKNR